MPEDEIPEAFQRYRDAFILPEGYNVTWVSCLWAWFLAREDKTADFRITDRTFGDIAETSKGETPSDINYWTGGLISKTIEQVIAEKGKAVVLDVACGPLNRAAYQIAQTYGDKVEVKAIDICGSTMLYDAPNIERIIGDALSLPYENGSIDVVYSIQFLNHLPAEDQERGFFEVLRVMGPNSHAVLDMLDPFGDPNPVLKQFYPGVEGLDMFEGSPMFEEAQRLTELMGLVSLRTSAPWEYQVSETETLRFRPVEEFRDSPPGTIMLNSLPTPYLHVQKMKHG